MKKSKVAWRGRFPVIEDLLAADHDGREHLYTYLGIRSTAVGILAVGDEGQTLLIDEYRHPLGRVVTDIPMGSAERGEDPATAASRELREETGWSAGSLEPIGGIYPVPALTSLRFEFFLARDLTEGAAEPEDTELIAVRWMEIGEVLARVVSGEFEHGGLPLALTLALRKGLLETRDGGGST
ncbi:MAG: NUDIX hydrolase [Chloroflexota bacterium]|nr:NUDIX hydrolase [Chloroflexota bacterium]